MTTYSPNFKQLRLELSEIFSKAEFELEGPHSLDTLEWVKKIDSNPTEALQIAALAHDIDRGIKPMVKREEDETYEDYKERHAKRSAQLIAKLMTKYDYPKDLLDKTSHLVRNHEIGGDIETDILMDADSISFFSCNIDWYYKHKNKDLEETKKGIKYKYERATPRAKKLIKTIEIKNKLLSDLCREIFI